MLGYLSKRAKEVMNGKPIVVQCRSGARSAIAASILQAQGATQVINMMGEGRIFIPYVSNTPPKKSRPISG